MLTKILTFILLSLPLLGQLSLRDPRWQTNGAGALASRPATCTANRHVYICNGAGCTANGEYHYCTSTNTYTVIGGSGGAPSGDAGGDLDGTYPNPTVAKVDGVAVESTGLSAGQTWIFDGAGMVPGTVGTSSVKPGNVKIQSSTVLLINDGCSSGDPCNLGQFAFTESATATITAGSGSGTAKVYRSSAGAIVVSHPTGAGVSITCVGCTQIQTASPSFPAGSLPLYNATITSGLWTAVEDLRVFVSEGVGEAKPFYVAYKAAICQNATASLGFSTPTSNPAVAACVTGTNTQFGVAQFADSSSLSVQDHIFLPPDWTGIIDVKFKWRTSATSGDVVWQVATICIADAETSDPAFNTASTVTDAAKGTTLQQNDAEIATLTVTGCAAGEEMYWKLLRDSAHASDTLAATADLIGVTFVIRRTL